MRKGDKAHKEKMFIYLVVSLFLRIFANEENIT